MIVCYLRHIPVGLLPLRHRFYRQQRPHERLVPRSPGLEWTASGRKHECRPWFITDVLGRRDSAGGTH